VTTSEVVLVEWACPLPSALTIQMPVTPGAMLWTNTILRPPGDHLGEKFFGPLVSCAAREPSARATRSFLRASSSAAE
jgi:hypothetical protein